MKTKLTELQKTILNILKEDKNKHIKGTELIGHIYWRTNRMVFLTPIEVRYTIRELRKIGYKIIADNRGYCFTTKKRWFQNYITGRRAELKDESITLNCMVRGVK